MMRVLHDHVAAALAALECCASPQFGVDLARRYGIVTHAGFVLIACLHCAR